MLKLEVNELKGKLSDRSEKQKMERTDIAQQFPHLMTLDTSGDADNKKSLGHQLADTAGYKEETNYDLIDLECDQNKEPFTFKTEDLTGMLGSVRQEQISELEPKLNMTNPGNFGRVLQSIDSSNRYCNNSLQKTNSTNNLVTNAQ